MTEDTPVHPPMSDEYREQMIERREMVLTDDEIRALIHASAEAKRIVKSLSATAQIEYVQTPWWSALLKLEAALNSDSLGPLVPLADVLDTLDRAYHPQMGENPAHPADVIVKRFGEPAEAHGHEFYVG